MRQERQGDGTQLHNAPQVRGRAQLKVALGPSLQQQQHDVKEEEEGVSTHATEGEAAGVLAVRSHGAHAGGACGGARDAELYVTGHDAG